MGAALDYYYNRSKIWLPMKAENHDPSHTTGTELLVDGDMEAAGVAAWTPSDSVLTKSTIDPFKGSQCLRITSTAGTFWAIQSILSAGKMYRVTGAARSVSGSAIPRIFNGVTVWDGTVSTDWQEFDITFLFGGIDFYLGSGSAHPGVVDFDNVTVEALESRTLDVSGYGNHAILGDGTTPGLMPTKLQHRGYNFSGVAANQRMRLATNPLTAITQGTWAFLVKPSILAGYGTAYLYGHSDGSGNVRAIILLTATTLRFYSESAIAYAGITKQRPQRGMVSLVAGGVNASGERFIYTDGEIAVNGTGVVPSTAVTEVPRIGSSYAGTANYTGDVLWMGHWEYALSFPELEDLRVKLLAEVNHV